MKSTVTTALALILCLTGTFAQTVLLSEDFQAGTLPVGWSQQTNATDGGWLLGNSTQLESQYWALAAHGNFIATNDDECDCDKSVDYLITPPLDLSTLTAAVLQFQNYFDGGSEFGGTEVATVEYSLNGGSTWTILETIVGTDDGAWDAQSISLNSLVGNSNVLLGFHYFDDFNWLFGWGIDDVVVRELVGLDLELSAITMNSALDVQTPTTVTGMVTNTGLDPIVSFDASWTIGGSVYTTNFSALSIPSLGTYNFSHADLLTLNTSGLATLDVSISNVNGQASDGNMNNNDLSLGITAVDYGVFVDGGINREYIYYHASSAGPDCPLVMVLHGYGGNAQDIMDYSEFNALAEEFGFAVCYPQGIEDNSNTPFWNVGYAFHTNQTVDDVAFITNLVDSLQAWHSLSDEDVFSTGMSNGGDFSYLLACEASDVFKGIAPIAGMMLQDIIDNCSQHEVVSILEIHGTQDQVTPINGDPNNNDGWGAYPSIANTVDFWTNRYGLNDLASGTFPDIDPNDGSTVSYDKHTAVLNCPQVWLYTVDGGGHDWPGASGNMDISASREAWLFFESLCITVVGMDEAQVDSDRTLLRIVDLLGRETEFKKGVVLLYQYSDGSVEKRVVMD